MPGRLRFVVDTNVLLSAQLPPALQDRYAAMIHALLTMTAINRGMASLGASTVIEGDTETMNQPLQPEANL